MKNTLKYSLIIISLLIIGFVIGFLVNGRLTHNKMKKVRSVNTEQGFNHEFRRIIKPTSEQAAELKPILKEFAKRNHVLMTDFRENQESLFKDLRTEIDPLLTEEQIDRLECSKKRWLKRSPVKKKNKPKSDSVN